jgi:type IV secretion system protein VirB9
MPKLLPLRGQIKPVPPQVPSSRQIARSAVVTANLAARVQPARSSFVNAMQVFPWSDGALYQIYAAPGQVTDIALQPGEQLVGTGPVAAGDTVRWIIGDTTSGTGPTERVHVLVKPAGPDLASNLVINTDRRTYHLELRATPATYMASVSWTYPQDQLIAIARARAGAPAEPVAQGVDVGALHFDYSLSGDNPDWRPLRAFDDGRQVFVEFPAAIGRGEMPPLFLLDSKGGAELVNYRVRDRFMIVDRLLQAAELRLGDRHALQTVRITHGASATSGKRR